MHRVIHSLLTACTREEWEVRDANRSQMSRNAHATSWRAAVNFPDLCRVRMCGIVFCANSDMPARHLTYDRLASTTMTTTTAMTTSTTELRLQPRRRLTTTTTAATLLALVLILLILLMATGQKVNAHKSRTGTPEVLCKFWAPHVKHFQILVVAADQQQSCKRTSST